MEKIEFKQNDLKRGVPFAIGYLVLVFGFCFFKFGGIIGMADAVDNLGSAKGAAFLIGLAILIPFFIILNVIMPKVSMELHSDKIIVTTNKKEQKVINYNDISKLQLHISNLNRLDVLDNQQNILYHLQPQNKPEILNKIISEISKHIEFTKQVGNKSYFGKNVEATIYYRKT